MKTLSFLLLLAVGSNCWAGPKEQVWVAEAFVWANQNAEPALPADSFQAKPPLPDWAAKSLDELQGNLINSSIENDDLKAERARLAKDLEDAKDNLDAAEREFNEQAEKFEQIKAEAVAGQKSSQFSLSLPPGPFMSLEPPVGVEVTSETLPAQLVIWHWERGCIAGDELVKDVKAVLIPLGWHVGTSPTDQIQIVTVGTDFPCPTLALYQNGRKIQDWSGRQDVGMLSTRLLEAWNGAGPVRNAPAMAGPGGAIKAGIPIKQMLDFWHSKIGINKPGKMKWNRSGIGSFPLLAKADWSAKALFGEAGRMDLSAPGAINVPIDTLGFAYRIIGNDVIFDADPITLAGLALKLGPPSHGAQAYGATPVQFVDPLTMLSIVSLIRNIWLMMHPSCDLQLGGTVSASAVMNADGMLSIDFTDAPQIKLVWLFTFQLKVRRVEITATSVRLFFDGSRFVKERTFSVQD